MQLKNGKFFTKEVEMLIAVTISIENEYSSLNEFRSEKEFF